MDFNGAAASPYFDHEPISDRPSAVSLDRPFARASRIKVVPDLTPYLAAFDQELDESGCRIEEYKPDEDFDATKGFASYGSFMFMPGQSKNTFDHVLQIPEGLDPASEIVSKRHEGGHAITTAKAVALHATPYNMATPMVLHPADFVRMLLLSERSTMAYNALLGYADQDPKIKEQTAKEPGMPKDFAEAFESNGYDIDAALNHVARVCLSRNSNLCMRPRGMRQAPENLTLENYYIWNSLNTYERSNTLGMNYELYDEAAPIFVRLGDDDILEMGEMMGLSVFGKDKLDPVFTEKLDLMWKHQRWVNALNMKWGICKPDELPTITQALNEYFGLSREQFLNFSKNYKQGDAPLPQVRPVKTQLIMPTGLVLPTYETLN